MGAKYVLVLKDGMSGFVELVPCTEDVSNQVYGSLLDSFKRFSVIHKWMFNRGAHFENQIIEKLQRALGAQHQFATAYMPCANGTVDVVSREFLRGMKALISGRGLQLSEWPRILPVIQSALNSMPADQLGGVSLVKTFTILPGDTQLRAILHPRNPIEAFVEWIDTEIKEHLQSDRVALDGIHEKLTDASEKSPRCSSRQARRRGVEPQRFAEGGFVLAATTTSANENKLALVWRGPKRILRPFNDYTSEAQGFIEQFAVSTRHASRL